MTGQSLPAFPAAAASSPALRIEQTVFDPNSLGEDRIVTVDISLDGNGTGLLAAEFGIVFDSRLTVADIRTPEEIAGSFVAFCSDENSMVWFCGAAADDTPLFSEDSATLFQVDFVLPEDIAPDDSYDIDYIWNGLDGAPAFWYAAKGQNIIDGMKANSVPGMLSCEVTVRREFRYSILDAAPITISSRDQVVILEFPDAVGTIQWLSTIPDVITVEDGVLTAVTNGTAQIIATNHGVSKMRTVIVQLEDLPTEPPAEETDAPALQSGDLNGDDAIDITDVIAINKFLLGSATLDTRQRESADVYHDGLLDTTDALTLLKYVVEMLPALPIAPT